MDTTAIAERLSASMASVAAPPDVSSTSTSAPETTTTAAPVPVPEVAPSTTTTPAAPAPTPELQFEDDPEPLKFDEEESAPPEPVAEAAPQPTATETGFEGALPKDVETRFLATERGRRILSTFKDMRELTAQPNYDPATGENLGGLGFTPHATQIKEWHAAQSDLEAMEHEFTANPTSFLSNWLVPDGNYREGAESVLGSIPQLLTQTYSQAMQTGNEQLAQRTTAAFQSLFRPLANEFVAGVYEQAKHEPDVARREWLVNVGRGMEALLNNGKYRPDEQLKPPTPQDELTQREQVLAQREQQIRTWQQRSQSEAVQAAKSQTISQLDNAVTQDISKAFSSVKDHVKPAVLAAYQAQFKKEMLESLYRNQQVQRSFNFALAKIRSVGDADASRAAIQVYREAARQWISANYRARLKDLADGAVSQNAAAHATAQQGASQTAPSTGNGHAAAQSLVPETKLVRQPGEDMETYMQRRFATRMKTVQ